MLQQCIHIAAARPLEQSAGGFFMRARCRGSFQAIFHQFNAGIYSNGCHASRLREHAYASVRHGTQIGVELVTTQPSCLGKQRNRCKDDARKQGTLVLPSHCSVMKRRNSSVAALLQPPRSGGRDRYATGAKQPRALGEPWLEAKSYSEIVTAGIVVPTELPEE